MIGKIFKGIITIASIPLAIAATKVLIVTMDAINVSDFKAYLLVSGFFSYPIFHILIFKPMFVYVLGHEIVHVLATWICGGKVTSFQVSGQGGNVATTKTNTFITLSPYFVPIHAAALFLIYWGLSRFFDVSKFSNAFVFLMGFTMSFHLIMTAEVLKTQQSDTVKTGYFFSLLLIYVGNIFIAVLALSLLFKGDISIVTFSQDVFSRARDIYVGVFDAFFTRKGG